MKIKHLALLLIAFGMITMSSCNKEDLFEQPTIEVTGYTLLELPGEFTYLEIDMTLTNNDDREAHIADVVYEVVIEGITSETMEHDVDQDILIDTPLELTLPLTLRTNEAIQLLAKLDAGEELSYTATGTFHVDDPILKLFDFPINVSGTATVDAGFEDFFEQPEVTVNEISGTFADNGVTHTFEFDVTTTVQNMDPHGATIDEVEYTVIIGDLESETHLYTSEISIDGNGTVSLTLPVTFNLSEADGAALAASIDDGTVDYSVEGTFHVIWAEGFSNPVDFVLPLYVTGNATIDLGNFYEQPETTVNTITGTYTINGFTSYTFDLDVNCSVQNMDTRAVIIDEVEYIVTVEGNVSETHWYSNTYPSNLIIAGNETILLTLPVTLNLSATQGAALVTAMANNGGYANYIVEGTFHAIDVDGTTVDFFLPLYDEGSADASDIQLAK